MTHVITPQYHRGWVQMDPELNQKDPVIQVDDVDPDPRPQTLDVAGNLTNPAATSSTQATKEASDDSDTDDDLITGDLPPSVLTNAQRKLAQNAVFEVFLRGSEETVMQGRSQHLPNSTALGSSVSMDDPSDSRRIIDRVRNYQSELFARAKAGNIIAVLDTGSGKTLIAALLLRDIVTKEMEDRASGKPPRTSFFLVNSVALAEQQHRMLCENLAAEPALAHGRRLDAWRRQDWNDLFNAHAVVVSTAEVLYQCLNHCYIKIENINLIIFDEAHHAKKEHPYARIVKDHYLGHSSSSLRPKIFGMTASPVDGKKDVLQAAHMLEAILNAKIVTTKSLSLDRYAPKATVMDWEYDRLLDPFETGLYQQLEFCHDVSAFDLQFKDAKVVSAELGPWCADQVWRYALEEEQFQKTLRQYERVEPGHDDLATSDMTARIEKLKQAEQIVRLHYFPEPKPTLEFISSKVLLLYHKLCHYFEVNKYTRCLIFVDRRITARVLRDLFRRLNVANLRPEVFLGSGGSKSSQAGVTGPQSRELKSNFANGFVNCLFCTSVAEEGIDSPECNLVIRFDLYDTMIQYVQSRGRARAKSSIYGQMIERENTLDRLKVDDAHYHEAQLRDFLANMEDDRFLESDYLGIHGAFGKEKPNKTFGTSAGTRCNYRTSITYLDRYASSLQYEDSRQARVLYEAEIEGGMFRFRTILPDGSPINGAMGEAYPNKTSAKQSAAWETCFALRAKGLLDENLNSIFAKRRPDNANARLAVSSAKKDQYDSLVKPRFWTMDCGQVPKELFATVVYLVPSAGLRREHDPLVLLTRSRFPSLPEFPVYLDGNIETTVRLAPQSSPYAIDEIMLLSLKQFTFQVFRDLFNKVYEAEDSQMPYWLAPTTYRPGGPAPHCLTDLVDLQAMADPTPVSWLRGSNPSEWCDQFLVDEWSGKYRYWSKAVLKDLNFNSPVPPGLQEQRHKGSKALKILESTVNLYGKRKADFLAECDQAQPVLQAELVQIRRNFLDRADPKEFEEFEHWYHICPEPLLKSAIPHGFISTALVFPAIMSRMDSYLIANEACQKVGLEVVPELALEAITKDADNTEEHREQQTHFQRGMGKNYERLEFLGDAFLKMTTTIMVFIRYPKSDELGFHVKRMEMICNLNLFNVAVGPSLELSQYIRTRGFNRRSWYPEGMILKAGKGANPAELKPVQHEIAKQALAQKTIADVSEALIGAAVLSGSAPNDYNMAVRAVTKLVDSPDHAIDSWSDYTRLYQPPSWSTDPAPEGFTHGPNSKASQIQARLDYQFQHPRLLRSAMTHPSFDSNNGGIVPDYQRLEFLGDSLLDMVCIRHLYTRFPTRDPQWLTEHKMAMVSNKFLGAVAIDLNFDKHLYYTGIHIGRQIGTYARQIRARLPAARAEKAIDFWTEIEDAPKCLSDTVESYIGAVFVDSGFDYAEVERFFDRHLSWYFSDMAVYDSFANRHPVTELQNLLQRQFRCREARLVGDRASSSSQAMPSAKSTVTVAAGVMVHERVVAHAHRSSLRYARVGASRVALGLLKGMSREEFRSEYGCTCAVVEGEGEGVVQVPVGGDEGWAAM